MDSTIDPTAAATGATDVPDALHARIGQTHFSDWMILDQSTIDAFAELTEDRQYIHVDPERAATTMFGGTIAHGLLLLSLLPRLRPASLRDGVVVRMGINYGFDRIRFIQPVRSGSRIRGAFTPLVIERRPSGRLRETVDAAIELNGADKPAMTARWLTEFVL